MASEGSQLTADGLGDMHPEVSGEPERRDVDALVVAVERGTRPPSIDGNPLVALAARRRLELEESPVALETEDELPHRFVAAGRVVGVLGDDVDVAEMALEAAFFELAPSAPPAAKKGFGFIPNPGAKMSSCTSRRSGFQTANVVKASRAVPCGLTALHGRDPPQCRWPTRVTTSTTAAVAPSSSNTHGRSSRSARCAGGSET